MKKVFVFTIALFAIFACSKEKNIIDDTNNGSVELMTFTASVEDPIMDGQTKATLGKDGVFAWAEGDAVRFYKSDGTYTDGSLQVVSEVLAIVVASGEYVSAVYPAAAGDGKYSVAFDQVSGPIVVAEVTGGSKLQFYHIGSMMTINITGVPQACKLEVKPNEFSGTYNDGNYAFTNGVPTLTASTPSLTVFDVATGDTGNLTASVANYDYANGFTLGLKDGNRYLYKKATSKDFDIATRATLLNMKALAYTKPELFVSVDGGAQLPLIQTGASEYSAFLDADADVSFSMYDSYNTDAFASGTTPKYTRSSEWILMGNIKDCSWNNTVDTYRLSYYSGASSWFFVKNVQFAATTASFKFLKELNNWNANGIVSTEDGNSTAVGSGYTAAYYDDASYGHPINFTGIDTSKKYDIYINTSGTKPVVYLYGSSTEPGSISYGDGQYSFVWDGSEASSSYVTYAKETPWGWGTYITTGTSLQFGGTMNNWTWTNMTYNGFTWKLENLSIASDGPYQFKFRTADENNYWGNDSVTGNYGKSIKGGNNISITLTAGKYNVYANAVVPDDATNAYINFNFVKLP